MKENKIAEISIGGAVNPTDLRILANLYLAGEIKEKLTIGKLTRILDIAPVNTWKHLNKLQKLGFIRKNDNVKKGQKKYISLVDREHPAVKFAIYVCGLKERGVKLKEIRK